MKKKFLSSLLALCMVLSMLPVTAFAASETATSAAYDAVTAVLTITGTGLPTSGTLDATKVTIADGTNSVSLTAVSSAALNSSTAIAITISGADKTAVDNLFANGAAAYTIAFAANWDSSSAAAIAAFVITATNIPVAPGVTIDYKQELITGYATATMEASKTADFATLVTNDLATAAGFAAAKLIPDTLTKDLYVRVKAADKKPAGIATKLQIPARPKAPDDSTAAVLTQPAIDTGVGKTAINIADTYQYRITTKDGSGISADPKQEWTTGAGKATLTTNTTALVDKDLIWVRTAAVVGTSFASGTTATSQLINTEDIGVASDKSAATVALKAATVEAGAGATLNITAAKGTDGVTALTGEKNVTVTSSVNTDGTTGKVFEGDVTFTSGSGTVTILGTALEKVGDGTRTLTVKITGVTDAKVTFAAPTLTVNPAPAAKLVVTQQPTPPLTNGTVLALQPVVTVQDTYGNTCADNTATITAAPTAGKTWTLGGTTSIAAVAGVAKFVGLTASSAAAVAGATITLTSGALTVASDAFTIPAPVADATAPTLSTATINGTALVLTYNEALNTTAPAAAAFTVAGIAAGTTVSSVAIAGSAVTLTMEKAAVSTDTVTVSYTVPESNKIQDTAGNAAVALTSNAVTNSTAPATFAVTVTVNKDGAAWSNHNKTITLQKDAEAAIAISTPVANGTYKILVGGVDTGKTVEVNSAAASATLDYYTVKFAVTDVAPASGSTVSATYDSKSVNTGDVVLGGKQLVITAVGKGANTYTYKWTGAGTNNATTAALTIDTLGTKVDATCAVTGVAAPAVTAAVTGGNITGKVGTALNPDPTLTVTLTNGKFAASLTTASFAVTALPAGITVKSVSRSSDTAAAITLTGTPAAVQSATKIGVTVKKDALNPATSADVVATCNVTAAVTSDYAVAIGAEAADGAGKTRAITCSGTDGKQYLVIQMTEGTGADAKVSVVMVNAAATVTVSYQVAGTQVEAWITNKMPKLAGGGATGATIYAYATTKA